jgi:hypothetical protein
MDNKLKIVDGFVWLLVTEKAKEIFIGGLFDLYILYSDDSESKVEGFGQLVEAIDNGLEIGIGGGYLLTAVVGQSEQCCEPITDGFYLGTMCPKCNKPFRKNFK